MQFTTGGGESIPDVGNKGPGVGGQHGQGTGVSRSDDVRERCEVRLEQWGPSQERPCGPYCNTPSV